MIELEQCHGNEYNQTYDIWSLPANSGFVAHNHDDVIMTTMASQITSLTIVYSTVYSDADQRKHQSSASPVFVWGIHWEPGEFPAQMTSNAENVSIWWRHHVLKVNFRCTIPNRLSIVCAQDLYILRSKADCRNLNHKTWENDNWFFCVILEFNLPNKDRFLPISPFGSQEVVYRNLQKLQNHLDSISVIDICFQ